MGSRNNWVRFDNANGTETVDWPGFMEALSLCLWVRFVILMFTPGGGRPSDAARNPNMSDRCAVTVSIPGYFHYFRRRYAMVRPAYAMKRRAKWLVEYICNSCNSL
jgi:hypothetical protein